MKRTAAAMTITLLLAGGAPTQARTMHGGSGADQLTGTAAADVLHGHHGDDRLSGRRGDDRLLAGPGSDRIVDDGAGRIVAGPGADHIIVRADRLDFQVDCGSGRDRIVIRLERRYRARTVTRWRRSCERRNITTGSKRTPPSAGRVQFVKYAGSDFDRFTAHPSAQQAQWMRDRFWRMQVYGPYFDSRTAWYPNGLVYQDLYAIYRDSELARRRPQWILKDAAGRRLYIPWGCDEGRCPQYAGDVGNPEFRAWWIAQARQRLAFSYRGLWIDDVNLHFAVSDGHSNHVAPVDPRTGKTMTHAAWKRYVAQFVTGIRRAFADREINHNSVWFAAREHGVAAGADPQVQRQIRAADLITIERGIVDDGLAGGTGSWSLHALLEFVDRVHAAGAGVIMHSYAATRAQQRYQLAGYLLISTGRDGLGDGRTVPGRWWAGYDVDLGRALGPRVRDRRGLWQRHFQRGRVLRLEPGARPVTVTLERVMCDADGRRRRQVHLTAAAGQVLRSC